jgi:UPF0716 family protein affecting phage T7 exclusion
MVVRVGLLVGGLTMIAGGWVTDTIGLGIAIVLAVTQKKIVQARDLAHGAD